MSQKTTTKEEFVHLRVKVDKVFEFYIRAPSWQPSTDAGKLACKCSRAGEDSFWQSSNQSEPFTDMSM